MIITAATITILPIALLARLKPVLPLMLQLLINSFVPPNSASYAGQLVDWKDADVAAAVPLTGS
jgi:hypothetical protein